MDATERDCIEQLTAYLAEAHEVDKGSMVEGEDHCGDGRDGCSYCDAIDHAAMILRRDRRDTAARREP